jgi:uncharacterized membrane protein
MKSMRRVSQRLDVHPWIRVLVAAAIGAAVGLALGPHSIAAAALGGWAVAGVVHVAWTWLVIVPMDAEATYEHALREEPTRGISNTIVLLASIASLGAVVAVLVGGGLREDLVALAAVLGAVVASWAVVHTVFALRYARMYYAAPIGGIEFHQKEKPRYTDFTYIAVTVGMSFAVSDTDLAASSFRRTAQVHALLAYLFGTVIVALLVNLVAGFAA